MNYSYRIYRFGRGVKLINPPVTKNTQIMQFAQYTGYTVASVLTLPFNFYFLDTQGLTKIMNEESALICGFESVEDSIGKSLFDVSLENSAYNLINNCTQVGILAHHEHQFSLNVNSDSCLNVNTDYRLIVNTFPK